MHINARTGIYLLLGNPVDHSLSPLIHNTAFRTDELNMVYLACLVADQKVTEAVQGLRALSIAGANVTSPYKERVIKELDRISPQAKTLSSVNTIVNKQGILCGYSTDGDGFCSALFEQTPGYERGKKVLAIGLGGALKSILYSMANLNAASITIANRTLSNAQEWADQCNRLFPGSLSQAIPLQEDPVKKAIGDSDLIIYGLADDLPWLVDSLSTLSRSLHDKLLIDLRYHPPRTEIMSVFIHGGGTAYNGLGMLIHQAALSYQLFTGRKAPLEAIKAAVREAGHGYN